MSKVKFCDPVPVAELMPHRSRSESPLKDALRDLRDGGTPPQDGQTTGTGLEPFTAASLGMRGVMSANAVQNVIVTLNNADAKAFYAYASDIPGVKGAVRVFLVTRERYEQTPAFRRMQRLTAAHGVAA